MSYNEEIESLLNKIETIVSKEYDESIDKLTKEYDTEITRLNAVIEAWKDVCRVSQNNEKRLEQKLKELCEIK
jgi:hypothetical protein